MRVSPQSRIYVGMQKVEQQHTLSVDCHRVKLSHIITCLCLMLYSEVTCLGDTNSILEQLAQGQLALECEGFRGQVTPELSVCETEDL